MAVPDGSPAAPSRDGRRETRGTARSSGGRDARRAMVVEFAGARAVGKSTLAPLVEAELRARGVALGGHARLGVVERLLVRLRTLRPRRAVRATVRSWAPSSLDERSFDRRLTRYLHRMHRYGRRPGVHVLAGGIGQMMMSVYAQTAQRDLVTVWNAFAAVLPLPDVVVVLEASPEEIAQRRARRGAAGDKAFPQLTPREQAAVAALRSALTAGPALRRGVACAAARAHDDLPGLASEVADLIVARLPRECTAAPAAPSEPGDASGG
jgi:hypothetical protein